MASASPLTTKLPEPSPNSAAVSSGGTARARTGRAAPAAERLPQVFWQLDLRAETTDQTALGERHRHTALGDVMSARQRARAHRVAHRQLRDADSLDVDLGSPSGSGSPSSFASSLAASERRSGPTSAIWSPARVKPGRPARRASGSRPTMPITGVG